MIRKVKARWKFTVRCKQRQASYKRLLPPFLDAFFLLLLFSASSVLLSFHHSTSAAKQLPVLASELPAPPAVATEAATGSAWSRLGLLAVERALLGAGDTSLRRRSRRSAAMRSSGLPAGDGGADARRQTQAWRSSASAGEMGGDARPSSSPTASPHRPQIHRPPYRARTPAMYGAVHSSVKPQHSHATSSSSSSSSAISLSMSALVAGRSRPQLRERAPRSRSAAPPPQWLPLQRRLRAPGRGRGRLGLLLFPSASSAPPRAPLPSSLSRSSARRPAF
ncbi:hypothetical protein GQ55_2G431800 [Panicum hallii var. hallii]|uniref:Uncharacterized protein n=1 Tax=Panicum hallii var. hallii TaxID=1504633 RepID=A0A2T7EYH9_9POAL|nr:hypothetical protein GQ55_2G431800 [Panicum hallii var. hallii]